MRSKCCGHKYKRPAAVGWSKIRVEASKWGIGA